jgi:hypothetical protein
MLCKAGGKEYSGWIRNSKTTEFLTELSMYLHLCRTTLIQSKQGGQEQGTWIHPRCAIHLAQWISPEFAVKITQVNFLAKTDQGKLGKIKCLQQAPN